LGKIWGIFRETKYKFTYSRHLTESYTTLIRVRSVVRVHPDPPLNPLESILSEGSENKFYFKNMHSRFTVYI